MSFVRAAPGGPIRKARRRVCRRRVRRRFRRRSAAGPPPHGPPQGRPQGHVSGHKWASRSSVITQLNRRRSSQSLDVQEPHDGARDGGTVCGIVRHAPTPHGSILVTWTCTWTQVDTSVKRPYLTRTEADSDSLWSSVITGPRRFISSTAWPNHKLSCCSKLSISKKNPDLGC